MEIKRRETYKVQWPSLVDLCFHTDHGGSWFLMPRSDLGMDWIKNNLNYTGPTTFSGGVPVEFQEVEKINRLALKHGLSVLIR